MDPEFPVRIREVTNWLAGRAVTPALGAELDSAFPPSGETFRRLRSLCEAGLRDGWLGQRSAGGIRYGRVIKASPETANYSVDVVEMGDIAGPHHAHPNGEIDMIMPLSPGAAFDGKGEGWLVYGPGSAHHPTVSGGKAIILYLLPEGAIEFTKA